MTKVKNFCKFGREQDELLIEMVSMHGALYDPSHEHYKDTIVRENIWGKIGAALHKKGDVCKIRWRSIRDLYGKKKRDSKRGIGPKHKWEYMDLLTFVDDVPADKIAIARVMKQESDPIIEETTISVGENVDYEKPQTVDCLRGEEEEEKENEEMPQSPEHEQANISIKRRYALRERKTATKRNKQANELLLKLPNRGAKRNDVSVEVQEEHPVRTFFLSMAQTVIGFPPALQAEAKVKVCQLIGEMECRLVGADSSLLKSQIPLPTYAPPDS